MPLDIGPLAHDRRAAWYRAEAIRIQALADATPAERGGESYARAAEESWLLAETLDRLRAEQVPPTAGPLPLKRV